MKEMTGVMAAAAEVQTFCQGHGWRFCFIGGIAVQRWGTPRFTQDVDLTLLTELGREAPVIDAILAHFPGRLGNARQFALERRVLLARTTSGVDLDCALGALPFEESAIDRASLWPISDTQALTTCSAEDLVILKVFAGRDRDWSDVEAVLARQRGRLDLARVRRELPLLLELKEDGESFNRLEVMIAQVDRRGRHPDRPPG
jgi:hypothetical protein